MIRYQIKVLDHQNPTDSGGPTESLFSMSFPENTPDRIITLALRGMLWEDGFVCEDTETFISKEKTNEHTNN